MDSRTLWSNVDSAFGSIAIDEEDLVGLTVQRHESWEDEEEWEEEEEWSDEDGEDVDWEDDEDDDFDDEDDDWED
jgi:hypothetical protein